MHPIRTHITPQASNPIHRLQLFQANVAIQRTPAEGVAMCLAARLSMANLRYTLNKHVKQTRMSWLKRQHTNLIIILILYIYDIIYL